MPTYGLATIFEEHAAGHEFTVENLPVHLTHVDSFEIAMDADALANKLRRALSEQASLVLIATKDVMYGPEKDIPVTELEFTPQLEKLHTTLINFLINEGALIKRPQFNGVNYSPHVSIYGSRRIFPGDKLSITDVSIAAKVTDAENANRKILANIEFK